MISIILILFSDSKTLFDSEKKIGNEKEKIHFLDKKFKNDKDYRAGVIEAIRLSIAKGIRYESNLVDSLVLQYDQVCCVAVVCQFIFLLVLQYNEV